MIQSFRVACQLEEMIIPKLRNFATKKMGSAVFRRFQEIRRAKPHRDNHHLKISIQSIPISYKKPDIPKVDMIATKRLV